MMNFTIVTDTSGNLPKCMADEYGLVVIPFYYRTDQEDISCETIESFDSERYYRRLKEEPRVTTTQITPQRYEDYFEPILTEGKDMIYVSMSSGVSGSCDAARVAAKTLKEKYPDRRIGVVDTKGAALGEGFVALEAARLRDGSLGFDEAMERLEDYSKRMCNIFTVDDLLYLRRGGRLSNASAFIGTILNIKPLLKGDVDGRITAFAKIRGRRKAVEALADRYNALVVAPEEQTVGIVQAACREDAKRLEEMICRTRPPKEIIHVDYEPVTTSYVGPGALALFFLGGENVRTEMDHAGTKESAARSAVNAAWNATGVALDKMVHSRAAEAVKDAAEATMEKVNGSKTVETMKDMAENTRERINSSKTVEAVKDMAENTRERINSSKTVEAMKDMAGAARERLGLTRPEPEGETQSSVRILNFWNLPEAEKRGRAEEG